MVIFFSIGVIVGCLLMIILNVTGAIGDLRIDQSDPYDAPYLFLELKSNRSPQSLMNRKYVTLKVNPNSYISQK